MCRSCVGDVFGPVEFVRNELSRSQFVAGAALAAGALAAGMPRRAAAGQSAGTIFRGGTILPVAGPSRTAQAVAIGGGRILAVGSEADVLAYKSAGTSVVDLGGRTLLPGFIDPHQHTVTGALIAAVFTYGGYPQYKTRQDVLNLAKDLASKAPPGGWVYITAYDNLLQGGDLSMADLDAVSKTVPIMVYYINMHTATANGIAFEKAFARAKIPQDVKELPGGGHFGRDASGKFDGMIYEETALKPFLVGVPKITPEIAGNAVVKWLETNAAAGNTCVHEAGVLVFGNLLENYERISKQTPCRASISLMYDSMAAGDVYKKLGVGARATEVPGTLFSLYAIKIVGDGSNQTLTAAQTQPYLNATTKGSPNYDAAQLNKMVAEVKANGWPVSIHCNGDDTLDLALDAIEAGVRRQPGDRRQPHRALHDHPTRADRPHEETRRAAQLPHEPRLLLRGRLPRPVVRAGADGPDGPGGAVRRRGASVHDPHRRAVFEHRHAAADPDGRDARLQSRQHGRRPGSGRLARRSVEGRHDPAAGQIGLADSLGTIEPGKYADLTILESDPYKVDPHKIMEIKVSETWVNGKQMFGQGT